MSTKESFPQFNIFPSTSPRMSPTAISKDHVAVVVVEHKEIGVVLSQDDRGGACRSV